MEITNFILRYRYLIKIIIGIKNGGIKWINKYF